MTVELQLNYVLAKFNILITFSFQKASMTLIILHELCKNVLYDGGYLEIRSAIHAILPKLAELNKK